MNLFRAAPAKLAAGWQHAQMTTAAAATAARTLTTRSCPRPPAAAPPTARGCAAVCSRAASAAGLQPGRQGMQRCAAGRAGQAVGSGAARRERCAAPSALYGINCSIDSIPSPHPPELARFSASGSTGPKGRTLLGAGCPGPATRCARAGAGGQAPLGRHHWAGAVGQAQLGRHRWAGLKTAHSRVAGSA